MNPLLDPARLAALAEALDHYTGEELRRLDGSHELPPERTHLLDRERLAAVFTDHGFTPDQFNLDVSEPDETLVPQMRIARADAAILAELHGGVAA